MSQFVCLQTIWHTQELCYYLPGSIVELPHLDTDSIALLIENGVVAPVLDDHAPDTAMQSESDVIDLSDGVDDKEATLAGRALNKRKWQ